MRDDDEGLRPKKAATHEIGSDLSRLSEHELAERVDLLKAEITRLEDEWRRKAAVREAAGSFFKR